jgi:hypothetical protein
MPMSQVEFFHAEKNTVDDRRKVNSRHKKAVTAFCGSYIGNKNVIKLFLFNII